MVTAFIVNLLHTGKTRVLVIVDSAMHMGDVELISGLEMGALVGKVAFHKISIINFYEL